eukprot:Nitzschia sp. Nitz4//scaffold526_size3785//2112//3756//NITZ4_009261-RA/size3785-processed-gene-0.3-mRNA-1//1//CDS//3329553959//7480//frame0
MGKDAVVSILSTYLHPSEHIRNKYPNPISGHRLEGCVVIRQEVKKIRRREQMAIVVQHDDFKTEEGEYIELHAVKRWIKISTEGPAEYFFTEGEERAEEEKAEETEVPQVVNRIDIRGFLDGDVSEIVGSGVSVEDDNEPAPENVPTEGGDNPGDIFGDWGHDGICFRRRAGGERTKARLKGFPVGVVPSTVQVFEHLFLKRFVKKVIIPKTSAKLESGPLQYGEFLQWIGLWLLMGTTYFDNRRDFWSSTPFTDTDPPAFQDRFWEVRQMLECWNANMSDCFSASWVSCLDESMSKWVNKYTCPGFMCVPRKPWPLGNEYHSIACSESGLMYAIELVEGRDEPRQQPAKEFHELGKTVSLLLRLTRPLWGSSKLVILDSGFCVLQGIVELRKHGVFASALIKKRRYWPKYIRGDEIAEHFQTKEVGDVDAWGGVLDSVKFHVYCMKEPDYIMSLMSSYGTLTRSGEEKKRIYTEGSDKRQKTFKYPEVVRNHFLYRDAVDAHNSSRMDPIALEETWKTT